MNWSYLFKHWFGTLLIAPLIVQIIVFANRVDNLLFDFFEYYFLFVLFGFFFSIPTYLLYALLYWYLAKVNLDDWEIKAILIFFAVAGIIITFSSIAGSMSEEGIISYSISSILTGIIFKLNFKNENN